MAISLTQSATAVGLNSPASFLALSGTPPYTYSISVNNSGGVIDPVTGAYAAGPVLNSDPTKLYDTIQVVDSLSAIATTKILVGSALMLLCEIIQKELGLAQARVSLWDQKLMQPTDSGLYVIVSMPNPKAFGNTRALSPDGTTTTQSANMFAAVDIDIISRGPEARDRKEEVVMALNSTYSQQQQSANSFFLGTIPSAFVNLNELDGAAIPYRYKLTVGMQYTVSKVKPTQYFDHNFTPTVTVNA